LVLDTLLQNTDEEPGVGSLTTAGRTTRGRTVIRRRLLAVLLARELTLTLAWGSTRGSTVLSLLALLLAVLTRLLAVLGLLAVLLLLTLRGLTVLALLALLAVLTLLALLTRGRGRTRRRAVLPRLRPVGWGTWRRTILLALTLRLAILLLLLLRGLAVLLLLLLGRWGRAAGSCPGSTTCGLCGLEFRCETHYCDFFVFGSER